MQYRILGKTNLSVSEIGFGGAPAGLRNYLAQWDPTNNQDWEQIVGAIHHAVKSGINYFDTAPAYGDGASEKMFGEALKPFREDIYIATKTIGESSDDVFASLTSSLKNLQTNQIDVLQYHGGWYSDDTVDKILAPDGALAGLTKAKEQGLVKFIGFTTEGINGPASRLLASGAFDTLQICYNLIYQHPYDPSRHAGMIYDAEQLGMGIITMRPLTSGTFQKWLRMIDPGIEDRVNIPRALLSFVLSNPMVDVALVGMRTGDEVDMNVTATENHSMRTDLDQLHSRYV